MSRNSTPESFWGDQFTPTRHSGPDWIWHGMLARGMCTVLTGHGKATGIVRLGLLMV